MYKTNYFNYLDKQRMTFNCKKYGIEYIYNGDNVALISDNKDNIMLLLSDCFYNVKIKTEDNYIFVNC